MFNSYDKKMVISGDIVEIYEYKNPVFEGFENEHATGRQFEASDDDKEVNREKVCNRAKRDVRRLINSNITPDSKFITLTFADNVTDICTANYEYKKFRQRLETYLGYKLQYVAVIEFQKRGAIHYHVLMFNVPYIKNSVLGSIWKKGFVKINKIDDCDNVGAYVCKYMTKNDDDRLKGQKMYFSSRGLERPYELKEKTRIDSLAAALPSSSLTFQSNFANKHNSISYKQYNLKSLKKSIEDVASK